MISRYLHSQLGVSAQEVMSTHYTTPYPLPTIRPGLYKCDSDRMKQCHVENGATLNDNALLVVVTIKLNLQS
jgi:hypothetical protein